RKIQAASGADFDNRLTARDPTENGAALRAIFVSRWQQRPAPWPARGGNKATFARCTKSIPNSLWRRCNRACKITLNQSRGDNASAVASQNDPARKRGGRGFICGQPEGAGL